MTVETNGASFPSLRITVALPVRVTVALARALRLACPVHWQVQVRPAADRSRLCSFAYAVSWRAKLVRLLGYFPVLEVFSMPVGYPGPELRLVLVARIRRPGGYP